MFEIGLPQEINDILDHREQRVKFQKKLLALFPQKTLLVFSLNIPGPIKNNEAITDIFYSGQVAIKSLLKKINKEPLYTKVIDLPSGLDWFIVVEFPPYKLKSKLVTIEDEHPVGRLFDMDILYLKNDTLTQVSREELSLSPRTCLICEKQAKNCARCRAHSVKDMQDKITQIYTRIAS